MLGIALKEAKMAHYDKFMEKQLRLAEVAHIEMKKIISPLLIPSEMDNWKDILESGAAKHGANNWLDKDGNKSSHKDMHDSMFHHLAESFVGNTKDKDSGFHPLLHLATRALMCYTRQMRNLVHSDDELK